MKAMSGVMGMAAATLLAVPAMTAAGTAELPVRDDAAMRQTVRAMRDGMRDVPLPLIIEALSGHHVRPWHGEHRAQLVAAADAVITAVNHAHLTAARANEAGNAVEDFVRAALDTQGLPADRPAGPSGHARAAGYPDLEARADDGTAFYVEVKTFNAGTEDSTQRTFYLSPSADFKVTRDAVHLLIAVELEHSADDAYHAVRARWLDLSRLKCDLKHEFNASNRDLYRAAAGLIVIERKAMSPAPP